MSKQPWSARFSSYRPVKASPAGPAHVVVFGRIKPGAPGAHVGREVGIELDRQRLEFMLKRLDEVENET